MQNSHQDHLGSSDLKEQALWAAGAAGPLGDPDVLLVSLQARITELEEALRGLLALDAAKVAFGYLDKGIGTATPNRAWLAARAALMEPKQ